MPIRPLQRPQAMSLMRLAGSNQYGLAGEALAESLVVAVTDAAGRAVPGQRIDFEIFQGVGSLETESAFFNAEGRASTQMTLGADADGTVRVTATLFGTGDFVEFTATVVDPAHRPTASARADPAVISSGFPAGGQCRPLKAPLVVRAVVSGFRCDGIIDGIGSGQLKGDHGNQSSGYTVLYAEYFDSDDGRCQRDV